MVGRAISYWNSSILGDMLVFWGVVVQEPFWNIVLRSMFDSQEHELSHVSTLQNSSKFIIVCIIQPEFCRPLPSSTPSVLCICVSIFAAPHTFISHSFDIGVAVTLFFELAISLWCFLELWKMDVISGLGRESSKNGRKNQVKDLS